MHAAMKCNVNWTKTTKLFSQFLHKCSTLTVLVMISTYNVKLPDLFVCIDFLKCLFCILKRLTRKKEKKRGGGEKKKEKELKFKTLSALIFYCVDTERSWRINFPALWWREFIFFQAYFTTAIPHYSGGEAFFKHYRRLFRYWCWLYAITEREERVF